MDWKVNLGIAVDVAGRDGARNLMVPNIKNVGALNFQEYVTAFDDLVARARSDEGGRVAATVRPEQVASGEPFATVGGTTLSVHFELDVLPGLTLTAHRPNLKSTAYGLLADFINAVRS